MGGGGAAGLGIAVALAATGLGLALLGDPTGGADVAASESLSGDRSASAVPVPGLALAGDAGARIDDEEAPAVESSDSVARVRSSAPPRRTPLSEAGGWLASLDAFRRSVAPDSRTTLRRVDEALRRATDPVVRQNCVFHAALALPRDVAGPWLVERWRDPATTVSEDALVALAFRGHSEARAEFVALARSRAETRPHRLLDGVLDHEALGAAGGDEAAAVLRSYRAIEVLDGDPYFDITPWRVRMAPWQAPPPLSAEERRALLEAWLARWPGHPGSDDVALRISRLHAERGDDFEAARWASRAAAWPDQDVTAAALSDCVLTCELRLSIDDVRRLALEEGRSAPNRGLLDYVVARRLAAEVGVAEGLAFARGAAARDASSVFALAFREELGSERGTPAPPRLFGGFGSVLDPSPEERLDPSSERLPLDRAALRRQLRDWERLAALEAEAAGGPAARRAEALYEQGALFYRSRDVFFPLYAHHASTFAYAIRRAAAGGSDSPEGAEAAARFEARTLSLLRAIPLFLAAERDHPGHPIEDRAVFSQGLAWIRLADYRPYCPCWGDETAARRLRCIREGTLAFERCANRFPESPLADDARRAAAHWRRVEPRAFE